ncbi:MAG: LuxR C-terminal-related transcriptional regulator [Myxococcota bacterium]
MKTNATSILGKDDLLRTLEFCNSCYRFTTVDELHEAILDLASHLGFEFVLCAYMKEVYRSDRTVNFANLSNPVEWMEEYHSKGYLDCDPVRIELERRLNAPEPSSFIVWDAYERELSSEEQEVISRRKHYGLVFGCSAFDNSTSKDSIFLVSLASKTKKPERRTRVVCDTVVPHMNRCRKRLDLLHLVARLTERELLVADFLAQGKSNPEIAKILEVSSSTVKYHVINILNKLLVENRQSAISILLAARYLS